MLSCSFLLAKTIKNRMDSNEDKRDNGEIVISFTSLRRVSVTVSPLNYIIFGSGSSFINCMERSAPAAVVCSRQTVDFSLAVSLARAKIIRTTSRRGRSVFFHLSYIHFRASSFFAFAIFVSSFFFSQDWKIRKSVLSLWCWVVSALLWSLIPH